jgi:multiple sugar transport system substrate-binding protein/sn-glycerol 3-phosphate transport system substrate-binding protein
MSDTNGKLTSQLVEDFNSAHPNITVEATYAGGYSDAAAKAQQAVYAGNGPDILQIAQDNIGVFAPKFVDLLPYMKKANIKESDFVQAFIKDAYYNKKLTDIPYGRSAQVLYINKTLLDSLGLKTPTTWEELKEVSNKCVTKDGNTVTRYGLTMPFDQWYLFALVQQDGASFFNSQKTGLGIISNGVGKECFQYLRDMQSTGALFYNNSTNDQSKNLFVSGKAAMMMSSSGANGGVKTAVNGKFQFVVSAPVKGKNYSMPTGGCGMGILSSSKHQAQAWEFFKWYIQDKKGGLAFVLGSGYLPFTKQMQQSTEIQELWKSDPNTKIAYEALQYGDDRYRIAKLQPVIAEFRTCIQAILIDNKDIDTSLKTFSNSVDTILK